MKLLKATLKITKGFYDILATYLLGWVLVFALISLLLHLGLAAIAGAQDFASVDALWSALQNTYGDAQIRWFRLLLFGAIHIGLLYLIRGPIRRMQLGLERIFDAFARLFTRLTHRRPRARALGQIAFSAAVTLLLIPFIFQPTLVPRNITLDAWVERGANLADGTASRYVADSVIGLYRKLYAEPVAPVGRVSADEVADAPRAAPPAAPAPGPAHIPPAAAGPQPLMQRWDPLIRRVAGADHRQFAYIKAFMWVESAGRQFAVSRTGCSGLMQFCAGTARTRPFRQIFGVGQVSTCQCDGPCTIALKTRQALETGQKNAAQLGDEFPCDPADARFDPERSIRAGAAYITRLAERFGGNIYLMYIGYNSGPAVAAAVHKRLGRRAEATLTEISIHLAAAMHPYYGAGSERRARSLVRTHLPKIHRAFTDYYAQPPSDHRLAAR